MHSKRGEFDSLCIYGQFGAASTLPVGGELSNALSPHRYSLTDWHSSGNGTDGSDASAYLKHLDGW